MPAVRELVYFPVLHTAVDLGAVGGEVQRLKTARAGRQVAMQSAAAIERLWREIEQALARLHLDYALVRVYQDGLPECGHEMDIVRELAAKGSRNYRLLMQLHERGATVMGTEDSDLLMREHRRVEEEIAAGVEAKPEPDALLADRDRHIATRIGATLREGETGILFIGMLHDVASRLAPDVRIRYPARRPVAGGLR